MMKTGCRVLQSQSTDLRHATGFSREICTDKHPPRHHTKCPPIHLEFLGFIEKIHAVIV